VKLILLGTTGYHPNQRRHTLSLLLPDCAVMLDAGTSVFRAAKYLVGPELDIFLTHTHLDHVVGLTFLFSVMREHPLRRITLHALPEKLRAVDEHLFNEELFPLRPPFDMRPLEECFVLAGGGRLTHFPLEHQGGSVGYRLDWTDRSMAYVPDTTAEPDSPYIEKIRGVDLLVHECNFPDQQAQWSKKTGHSHTTAVAELARRAEVGRLVLVHYSPLAAGEDPIGIDVARRIFPPTILGDDEMQLEF